METRFILFREEPRVAGTGGGLVPPKVGRAPRGLPGEHAGLPG